jgi:peptidyl-prolyl cis-trans isomerase C/peptidyl-prolyl cis-trans isomerase SurA
MPSTPVNTPSRKGIFHLVSISKEDFMKVLLLSIMAVTLLATACGESPVPGEASQPPVEDIPVEVPDTTNTDVGVNEVTTVGASHILISYAGSQVQGVERSQEEARTLITELEGRIAAGEIEFAQAASEYSDCPSGADGGALGVFGRGAMVPAFEQAAFSLGVGEVSGVVETQFGYHLILRTQ